MMSELKSNLNDLAYTLDQGAHQSLREFKGLSYPEAARGLARQLSEKVPELGRLLHISSDTPNAVVWAPISVTSVEGDHEAVAYVRKMDDVSHSRLR
jgi:hypothetical protein